MYYMKPKNYSGRWIVRIVQAALIFGIAIFGIDLINQSVEEPVQEVVIVESEQPQVQVITIQSEAVEPELDSVDYFYLALDHQMSDEYSEAIADYTRSIDLNDNLAPSYLNRGVAYEQMGNNEYRAMADFTQWMMRDDMVVLSRAVVTESINLNATMSANYRYDVPLALNDGDVVNLSVVSVNEDEVDPIIVLLDANGRPVAANDDVVRQDGSLVSMNSYIGQYEVGRSGEYTLMVSHAGGGSYGNITIRVTIDN